MEIKSLCLTYKEGVLSRATQLYAKRTTSKPALWGGGDDGYQFLGKDDNIWSLVSQDITPFKFVSLENDYLYAHFHLN